uniref:Replication enhancer n=1 Tax=Begomovirus spathoglottis 1 TaxID=3064730 RepID=A0AA49K7M4_9GEMI|nr:AL3 [Begomovirus spathoglottis 1]
MDSRTGELITSVQANSGVFVWELKSGRKPLSVQLRLHNQRGLVHVKIWLNHCLKEPLQIHRAEIVFQLGTTIGFSGMQYSIWTQNNLSRRIEFHLWKYIDNLGVFSLNVLVRAVNNLFHLPWVTSVGPTAINMNVIMFKYEAT